MKTVIVDGNRHEALVVAGIAHVVFPKIECIVADNSLTGWTIFKSDLDTDPYLFIIRLDRRRETAFDGVSLANFVRLRETVTPRDRPAVILFVIESNEDRQITNDYSTLCLRAPINHAGLADLLWLVCPHVASR